MDEEIRVGSLDQQITIQSRSLAKQSSGQETETWSNFAASIWANISYGAAGEKYEADEKVSETEIIFTIRYLASVNETMRVVYDSENYYIKSISRIGRQRYLKIKAEKKDNE